MKSICIWCVLFSYSISLFSQSVPCDRTLYMALTPAVGQTAELKRLTVDPVEQQAIFSSASQQLNIQINAMGYCVADGYLYGLDPLVGTLYKIDASGTVSDLGIPPGLNTTYEYYAGEVTPNGRNLLVIGRSRDDKIDRVLYSITLDSPTHFAGYLSIVCDWQSSIGDIAIDPKFGVIRGYDNATHRLVNISSGGNVTSTANEANGQISLGSLFFDPDGNLYGYGSSGGPESALYHIALGTGKTELIDNWINGRFTDGCACPYRFVFTKEALDSLVVPCAEVTLKYTHSNTAGTPYSLLELRDTFPPDFEIISISGLSNLAIVESGPGSSILYIRQIESILGDNSIEVKVRVGPNPGVYASHANIGTLPYALGIKPISDDPRIPGGPQATAIKIVEGPQLIADTLRFLCPGLDQKIAAVGGAQSYQWSSGQQTASIAVQTPGWYSVTATSSCGVFIDSVEIRHITDPLFIDLGPDTVIVAGDNYLFTYHTNGEEPLGFEWSASTDSVALSCISCSRPSVTPLAAALYTVRLTDVNGCIAEDQQTINILPNVRIYYPNAFSPNSDGINDLFFLFGKAGLGIRSLIIFDRWGGQVFALSDGQLNDPGNAWDGTARGKPLAAGSYIFVAEIRRLDGSIIQVSDLIELIR